MTRLVAALLMSAAVAVGIGGAAPASSGSRNHAITGPLAHLLAVSTDLGPSRASDVRVIAALADKTAPGNLMAWARNAGLSVRWRPGDEWAVVEGVARTIGAALGVEVHDYRGRRGQFFYASTHQPEIPLSLRQELIGFGRILGYTPYHDSRPSILPLDVPDRGLTPVELRNAYNASPLISSGYTGKGMTIVVFGFDGFDQSDLDTFTSTYQLPAFTPTVVGDMPTERTGETTMDLEMAHAIAPDARKVFVNARPTVSGGAAYENVGRLMEATDRAFPGAVWSLSIGWGCDKLLTAADLAPVRSALAKAHSHGTTAFDASGDLAGLECKGGQDWSAPPGPDDVGLDAVASLPEMTDVGGTTLSTDAHGGWLAEQAWFDVPMSHGSGGGTSALFDRPTWQRDTLPDRSADKRLTPDVAAVADAFTGAKIVFAGQDAAGGGTSMSAPIWAGLAAVMDQYLLDHHGHLLGDLNPLLYRVGRTGGTPAFRDVVLGGNAVDPAGPGYDMVTGLGTPEVDSLARALLVAQATSG